MGKEKTNDGLMVVASEASVAISCAGGDLVLIMGILAPDKDFGSGCACPVIIENATMKVKGRAAKR
jgi:hypothetical protein